MNPINLFLLISAFQGFVLGGLIIFSPYFKSKANNYLGLTIVILSLLMFNIFLSNIRVFDNYPKLFVMDTIEWVFLFPVLFFYYILNFVNHRLLKNKKIRLLYIPIIISIVIHLIESLEYDYALYSITLKSKDIVYDVLFGLEEIFSILFNILMLIWCYRIIKSVSDTKNSHVKWLKSLWFIITFMVVSWVVLIIVEELIINTAPELDNYILSDVYILAIQLCVFVYWVAYNGLYKLKLANGRKEILDMLNKNGFDDLYEEKTKSVHFTENNPYFLKLESLLQKQFIYRNPDLNRETIAQKLGISPGYLSQIINTITQKNFAAYINSYRIDESKRMLLDDEFNKYSLLSIGLESGFKSKTTFYNSFKKETGYTPSEFKKQHK